MNNVERIIHNVKNAPNPMAQVVIEADLADCTHADIVELLRLNGIDVAMQEQQTMEDKFKELYEQGLTDPQIAERAGCDANRVCAWRRKNSIPSHTSLRIAERQKRYQELYDAGKVDMDIAMACGIAECTVAAWRKSNNLPPNGRRRTVFYAAGKGS